MGEREREVEYEMFWAFIQIFEWLRQFKSFVCLWEIVKYSQYTEFMVSIFLGENIFIIITVAAGIVVVVVVVVFELKQCDPFLVS